MKKPKPPAPDADRQPALVAMTLQTRLAPVVPGSIDAEARTVEVVWSAGARVRRYDYMRGRVYEEELSLDPAHVDLARLNAGAPLLDTHNHWELGGVIGVVEKAWVKDGEGRALVRFSERAEVAPIFADVKTGIIRNVSVGYEVRKYEITEEEGKPPLYRATDWAPLEISLVPVGADAAAGTRADPGVPTTACEFVNRASAQTEEDTAMKDDTPTAGAAAAPGSNTPAPQSPDAARAAAPAPDPETIRRDAVEAERKRGQDIRARTTAVGLPAEVADDLIARGVATEHVANALIDEIAKRGGAGTARPGITMGRSSEDPAEQRATFVEALCARAASLSPALGFAPTERARSYVNMPVMGMLAEYARLRGVRIDPYLPPAAMFDRLVGERALSTSDFPIILADAGRKIMVKAYELAAPTYRLIFAKKPFRDFKPHNHIRAGDFPVLLEKGETAEFKYGSMGEAKNPIVLGTFGRIVGLSRRVLINDDMGAFTNMPEKGGRRVADFENATAWGQAALNSYGGPTILEKNLPNGRPLFHADHGNLAGSGAAIAIASVGAGRAAMMKQKSLDGLMINPMPRYLVTSPDKFTDAESFCAVNVVAAKDADANPFKGRLTPLSDGNLTGLGNAWHLYADPAVVETLVYGYLEGAAGPQFAVREGFTTDGIEFRLFVDFAAGAVDYRGAYKNPGA